jgi:hypothetical protein
MRILQRAAFAGLILAGSSVLAMSPSGAQDIPNLVGTWKGETQAVHIGPNPYRVPDTNGPNFPDNFIEFTYVVKQQEGTRFAGETEGKFTETFIGMLKPPEYRSGIFIDNDGQYDFTLRDDTTIDMCYWHQYPTSKVVACWTLTKQP